MAEPTSFEPPERTDQDGPDEMCEFLDGDEIVTAQARPGPHGPGSVIEETPGGRTFAYDRTRDTGVHVYRAR